VESEPDQRRRVVAQLTNWGYVPVAAASGEDALELVAQTRFALALIAIRLPGMSGIELLRRASELKQTGPVVMIADSAMSSQIVEAIQAGADDFLRRPYTAEDVENSIKTHSDKTRPSGSTATDETGEHLQKEMG